MTGIAPNYAVAPWTTTEGVDALAAATTPTSTSTTTPVTPPADSVTPGPAGFLTILGIALVVIVLIFDMVRRIRRVNYRQEIREKLDQEERDAAMAAADARRRGERNRGGDGS